MPGAEEDLYLYTLSSRLTFVELEFASWLSLHFVFCHWLSLGELHVRDGPKELRLEFSSSRASIEL